MAKIALIVGSVRHDRQGIKVARWMQEKLKDRNHTVFFIDPIEINLPLLDRMYKEITNPSEMLRELENKIKAVEGYMPVTPEYNHSTSAAIKNTLDYFLEEYYFKPSAIVSYSPGVLGGINAAQQMRLIFAELGAPSIPSSFPISKVHEIFGENGKLIDERYEKRVKRFLDEFEWYIDAGMSLNKKILIVIIIVVVALAIPFAIYTISPLFISNSVNEPLPTTAAVTNKKAASQEYQKFISMNEQDRINVAKQMNQRQKNVVMIGAAAQVNNTMNENIPVSQGTTNKQQADAANAATVSAIRTGSFIGAGDGFHNAEGLAKVIPLEGGHAILRLENFKSTNGPNVHLYLATAKAASNFIDLGRLKANNGNQNYNIPVGTDLSVG